MQRERERERENKSSKKWLIWIILGIVLLVGGGVTVYYLTKSKETKPSTINHKATNEVSFQKQLSTIKKAQQDLNQAILQHENILKEKQKEFANLKQTPVQIKDTQKLEQHITELKTKKAKIESILPKLEEQISQLQQEAEQTQRLQLNHETAKQIQQKIKELNQELGIVGSQQRIPMDDARQEVPANNPISDDISQNNSTISGQNSPNLQTFQALRSQSQELATLLEKIVQDYEKRVNDFNAANKQAKEQGFDMGEIKKIMDSIQHHLEIAKSNKSILVGYASEKDHQTFLTLDPATQQSNISLIQDAIKHALSATKENLNSSLGYAQEMLKVAEEMFKRLEENGLVDEETTKNKQELEESKKTLTDCQTKLTEMEKQNIAEQIKVIREVWQKLEELEEKNK